MVEEQTVLYSKRGAVAHVVLNRPRVINAYNVQMRDEIFLTLEAVRDDPDVRAVIVSGAGDRGFCAGADLTEFGTAPSIAVARQVRWERDIWGLFLSIRKPIIAAMHGFVIGSGVEIACLCDIRIASDDSIFRMPEVALGMVPAAGGTQMLPRTIGLAPSLEMILTNRIVKADEAKRLGLVHEVVQKDDLMSRAGDIADELAELNEYALAAVKEAMISGMDMLLDQGLALENRLVARLIQQTRGG